MAGERRGRQLRLKRVRNRPFLLFILSFEAENERKSQDRLKRGRLPLFRGLSSQKHVCSCTSKAFDGHVDHCASNELVDKFGTSPYAPHHLDSSRFWVSLVLPLYSTKIFVEQVQRRVRRIAGLSDYNPALAEFWQ